MFIQCRCPIPIRVGKADSLSRSGGSHWAHHNRKSSAIKLVPREKLTSFKGHPRTKVRYNLVSFFRPSLGDAAPCRCRKDCRITCWNKYPYFRLFLYVAAVVATEHRCHLPSDVILIIMCLSHTDGMPKIYRACTKERDSGMGAKRKRENDKPTEFHLFIIYLLRISTRICLFIAIHAE